MASILLIEPESPLVRLAGWFLTEAGYEVTKVECLEQAAKQVSNSVPDVIVFNTGVGCDIKARCIGELRGIAKLPAVLDIFVANKCRGASPADTGADQYLPLPFDADTLLEAVTRLAGVSGVSPSR